jgi:Beta-lactamase enzyme family
MSLFLCSLSFDSKAQPKTDSFFYKQLLATSDQAVFKQVLSEPNKYRCQIIYTQINRNKKGAPSFKNIYFNVDPDLYFNPASMVKMPLTFLALGKMKGLSKWGINKFTPLSIDSSYPKQVAMSIDSSAPDQKPSIAHFIKRALLISENDPYNRLYQFVGQGPTNTLLQQKGYASARITRQFMGYTEEQNRHTNGFRFYNTKGEVIYYQPPGYHKDSFGFPTPILIGEAHINRREEIVKGPFDFTRHNNISLEDLQNMLQAVVFPSSVPRKKQFNISKDDRLFLLQFLSQYPSETNYPLYNDSIYYDSYVKFFFNDSTQKIPNHIRVFNKVGWAYGFLTDVSYVVDTVNNIDYFLSATLYVNSDGVVNDSKYDEASVGFPFLRELGRLVYNYELTRSRNSKPSLDFLGVTYEKRTRYMRYEMIKVVDN